MSTWIALKQGLAVMDAVERAWGRELGLEAAEVMTMLLLSERPGRSTSEIALFTGRHRQHVWRSLRGLAGRNLVHPTRVTTRGVEGWSLAPAGLALARRLEMRLAAWEAIMSRSVDLPMVAWSLRRMVESVVNRPSSAGWRRGLVVPEEARLDPDWDLHLEGAVLPAATPTVEGPDSAGRTDAEVEAIAAAWHALWN